jgi:hypothetical protein
MSNKATILIVFAWVMEIVGVTTGVVNSTYTTFGDDLPKTLPEYIPAVPMVALAVADAHSGDRAHSFRRIATTRSDRSRPV